MDELRQAKAAGWFVESVGLSDKAHIYPGLFELGCIKKKLSNNDNVQSPTDS